MNDSTPHPTHGFSGTQPPGSATAAARVSAETWKLLAGQFLGGEISADQFWQQLHAETAASLEHATVDIDRHRRCGYPEVIFGEGKSLEALVEIVTRVLAAGQPVLATRVPAETASQLNEHFPGAQYNSLARTWRLISPSGEPVGETTPALGPSSVTDVAGGVASDSAREAVADRGGPPRVAVVTAGTSDAPVAEEAAETLDWMGVDVLRVRDVGVAGPHRIVPHVPGLRECQAVVVVAGMEGALPSVVAGHVACPVIGVPTSVGYGANLGGMAALLAMLNSCAANVVVVNIDAGFKGGYVAGMIAHQSRRTAK